MNICGHNRYVHELAVWGGHHLARVWNTTLLHPDSMTGFMINVRLPTNDPKVANSLASSLIHSYDTYMIVIADDSSGEQTILYTRLSAQIYLEREDFITLGQRVLDLLATIKPS